MGRPRICLCSDSAEPSGVGEHMLTLAQALASAWDILLAFAPTPGGRAMRSRAARAGLAHVELDPDSTGAGQGWMRLAGVDLMHVHAGIGWEGHGLARSARAAGIGCVVRTEHLPFVITDPQQMRAHREGLALVNRVICVSDAAACSFRAAGCEADKLITIPNGIAPRPARLAREVIRAFLGLAPDAPAIVTVGRFTPQKGYDVLLRAAPAILAAHPRARFLLAGDGPIRDDMQRFAVRLDIAHAVRFLGQRDDVPNLLAAADLFVLASRFEGLPLALLEAMAAGLPVVATRIGGVSEVVTDGVTGTLVPPDDDAALAAAVVAFLSDIAAARRAGTAGQQRFTTAFQAPRMAASTARLYRELLGAGLQPSA